MESVEELQGLIRQIQLRFSVFYGMSLAEQGVSLRQFSILVALVRAKQMKMGELAKALHVSMPAVTQLVDSLEGKKLVQRLPHETDRRVTLVALTQGGSKLAAKTQGRALKLLTEIFLEFPKKEREAIGCFMHAMSRKLGEAIEEQP